MQAVQQQMAQQAANNASNSCSSGVANGAGVNAPSGDPTGPVVAGTVVAAAVAAAIAAGLLTRKDGAARTAVQAVPPPCTGTIEVFIYETEERIEDSPALQMRQQLSRLPNVQPTVFGQGSKFEGFGSKWVELLPYLDDICPDHLVVVTDARDVLINIPKETDEYTEAAVREFRASYGALVEDFPGAVVVSSEAQCCVSALTHARPGDYYEPNGQREKFSCLSGRPGCQWNGNDRALPWKDFMRDLAEERLRRESGGRSSADVYLNAGLVAGSARNLLRLLRRARIRPKEDDQAVLTDYLYNFPEQIVLDYLQSMFSNNRWSRGAESGCMFELPCAGEVGAARLVHRVYGTSPLFIHSPGRFFQCHDSLAQLLAVDDGSGTAVRQESDVECVCNYGLTECSIGANETDAVVDETGVGSSATITGDDNESSSSSSRELAMVTMTLLDRYEKDRYDGSDNDDGSRVGGGLTLDVDLSQLRFEMERELYS
jgi:hypothetical protein